MYVCADTSSNYEFTVLETHRSLAKQDKLNKSTCSKHLAVTESFRK